MDPHTAAAADSDHEDNDDGDHDHDDDHVHVGSPALDQQPVLEQRRQCILSCKPHYNKECKSYVGE